MNSTLSMKTNGEIELIKYWDSSVSGMTKAVILARVSTVKQEKATLTVLEQAESLGRD